jgi:oxygen-independent coproporphyrinogen-3 oxidase
VPSLSLEQYQATQLTPAHLPAVVVEALYVHIPFCFHKCHYCDFYSITRQTEQRMGRFVDRILREAELWADASPPAPRRRGPRLRPRTVFFGGGTPSLLPLEIMRRLLVGLKQRLDFSAVVEWTIECNPATVSGEYCAMLREMGVNRLSFGAQSFHADELALLERHHHPDDVARSLDLARRAGFRRLNLDLIYAIPGQSLQRWSQNLEQALALGTEHLSCYGLTYEPNTPIAVKKRLGRLVAADDELELAMLHHTRRRLARAGLGAYEVSNYARPGAHCAHNLVYWHGGDYIALGPSGASHVQGHRWKNRGHLGEWEQAIDGGVLPVDEHERLSPRRRAGELAMLLLRLSEGLDFEAFHRRTGLDARAVYAAQIDQMARAGLLDARPERIALSERGLNVADAVAAEFLLDD